MKVIALLSVLSVFGLIGVSPETSLSSMTGHQPGEGVGTDQLLPAIDGEMRRMFPRVAFERKVTEVRDAAMGFDPDLCDVYTVINYSSPRDLGELKTGAEVWIKKTNGKRFVVAKSLLVKAYTAAMREGIDLTQYDRSVEMVSRVLYVRFARRPTDALHPILDGAVIVPIDVRSGRVGKILLH